MMLWTLIAVVTHVESEAKRTFWHMYLTMLDFLSLPKRLIVLTS